MSAEYWDEAIGCAFDSEGVFSAWGDLPGQTRDRIAGALQTSHEMYGMAHYTPPPSDRINVIEREWEAKIKALQRDFDDYREDAETAVKRALRQNHDANVSIGKHGEVLKHSGRTTVIQ